MKVISIPSSGKLANTVAYVSPFGQIFRTRVIPRNIPSAARDHMRGAFGNVSQAWGRRLSEEQRDRWNYAGPQVMSHPRCGQSGPLSGQQHFQAINSSRACIGLPPLWEPPAPVVFAPSPVGELVIEDGEDGARLFVRVNGEVDTDIMVFGQAPCSAGRSKRRNVSYLGLLGPAVDGLSEITGLYKARFGEPRAGTKVFIVTCQQREGWEGPRHVTSEIVPGAPAKHAKQAKEELNGLSGLSELNGLNGAGTAGGAPGSAVATGTGENSQKPLMHKGCSRGEQGTDAPAESQPRGGASQGEGDGKAAGAGLATDRRGREQEGAPGGTGG